MEFKKKYKYRLNLNFSDFFKNDKKGFILVFKEIYLPFKCLKKLKIKIDGVGMESSKDSSFPEIFYNCDENLFEVTLTFNPDFSNEILCQKFKKMEIFEVCKWFEKNNWILDDFYEED